MLNLAYGDNSDQHVAFAFQFIKPLACERVIMESKETGTPLVLIYSKCVIVFKH